MALPTNGRVIIDTTAGEIEIELWSKETPRTCRNFIALALEGYYDGVIFHRIVPGFLVQTGDKTGTGGGGESLYGEPFEDEIHPRLRYAHRGLVAMANNGTKNSNDSQFFITLDRADELHGKHTLFGRVIGDTVYNVMKIGEMEIGENERPVYPPKIKSITIVDNPFPDIIPRITAAEKRAQQRAREAGQREREEAERRRGAKKDVKLLSFGGEQDDETEPVAFKKKNIARPDLVDNPDATGIPMPESLLGPPKKSNEPPRERASEKESSKHQHEKPSKSSKSEGADKDIKKIRETHAKEKASGSDARRTEIEQMESEIRRLTRKREGGEDSDEEAARKKAKPTKSYLEEELAKYSKGRGLQKKGKGKKDEGDVLAALNSFRGLLQSNANLEMEDGTEEGDRVGDSGGGTVPGGEDPGIEVDDDRGFIGHALHFPKDDGEETRKAERDYEVIDPRQRGAKAREEERERKRTAMKGKNGRGRR
ncbi:cyclophilin-like domain-containing protein [Suillus discolor]|uniref:Cyclophilin-like domain-containing protein n=1 Tax=Suillus discolor TaxID=1912936 RepID=A0A9P7F989_9AGAM|nr:cyclophilin-like domain-containing protein [Suillus discolor]KAG2110502.1 cyclophilin-like domain-containing protein [Suillus discolor]